MEILNMSFAGAVLILAIVIIRALALHRLPKRTFLVLWIVALCRLMIPFSISSRFSIYTLVDLLKTKLSGTDKYVVDTIPIDTRTAAGTINSTFAETASAHISSFMVIWLIGLVVCALFFIGTHLRCRREYKTALPVHNEFVTGWQREHPTRRTIEIRQSDRIIAPLTYGVFRSVILLPKKTDWTNETEMQYVLIHEFVHIRRFDTLTKWVLAATLCVHWFNPLVWVMYVLANRDIELSCDEAVVQIFGETMKSAYALTLIGLEEKKSRLFPLVNNFSKNAIEERIVSIMKLKKTSFVGISLAVVLVIGTATIFASNAAVSAADTESVGADKESGRAFEDNTSLSDEKIAKQEQECKEEIAKQYSIYSKYGLTYNQEKDRFFYNGQLVRFFADNLDENGFYNSFSYTDGNIDLRGVRNAKYELIGVESVSQEEYDQRTAKIQVSSKDYLLGIQENADSAAVEIGDSNKNTDGVTQENTDGSSLAGNGSTASEAGYPNYVDNSLNAYTKYGVSYDNEVKVWMYQGKPIHCLYDEGYTTFIDNSSLALKDGLSLKVVRNANGSIEQLARMTEADVEALFT